MGRILAGPKHTYPAPVAYCDYTFRILLLELDKDGHDRKGDHHSSFNQMLPLVYDTLDNDTLVFVAVSSIYSHPKSHVNVRNGNGLRILIACTNDNEQLHTQSIFQSCFDKTRLDTLFTEGVDADDDTKITIAGDCPSFNAYGDKMELVMTIHKTFSTCVASRFTFKVDKTLFEKWVTYCKQ